MTRNPLDHLLRRMPLNFLAFILLFSNLRVHQYRIARREAKIQRMVAIFVRKLPRCRLEATEQNRVAVMSLEVNEVTAPSVSILQIEVR